MVNIMLTELQLKRHNSCITGSKIGSLLGLPKAYQSKFELFSQMKGYTTSTIVENERMIAGSYMEEGMHAYCEGEYKWKLVKCPDGFYHPDYDFIYGLPDRLRIKNNKPISVIEFKNVDAYKKSDWDEGPPEKFKAQLYLYMNILDLPGQFVVCFGGNKFEKYDLPRNPAIEAFIIKKCCEFWNDLQNDNWPSVDGTESCTETLKQLYNNPNDELIDGGQESLELLRQYDKFSKKELDAKRIKDEAGNKLRGLIGNNTGIIFQDGSKATWKMTKPKKVKFNEEQFGKENPELYKRYLYPPAGYRRFHVTYKGEN